MSSSHFLDELNSRKEFVSLRYDQSSGVRSTDRQGNRRELGIGCVHTLRWTVNEKYSTGREMLRIERKKKLKTGRKK
jgi:hypothetical protein